MWRPASVDRVTGLFIALVIVSLMLVTVDIRAAEGGFGSTLRDGAQTVFTPIQKVASAVTDPVVGFFEGISDLVGLRDENERLRSEVAALESELQATEADRRRLEELEKILGVSPPGQLDSVSATVLAVGISDFDHIRVIDKGRSDGITVDMPVVDEGGLVGRVVSVTDDVARVRLITDPTVRVAVRVERTGETGVLTGRGSGPMTLELFNTDAAVIEGDLLVTADGRFPAGITVAIVTKAARAEVGFALRTSAEPTAEITRVDFVKVIVFTRDDSSVEELQNLEDEPVGVPIEGDGQPSEGEGEAPIEPATSTP